VCVVHSMQPSPNYFVLLFTLHTQTDTLTYLLCDWLRYNSAEPTFPRPVGDTVTSQRHDTEHRTRLVHFRLVFNKWTKGGLVRSGHTVVKQLVSLLYLLDVDDCLCIGLTIFNSWIHRSHIWSASIALLNPQNAADGRSSIYETPWSTRLLYVCQYHSK